MDNPKIGARASGAAPRPGWATILSDSVTRMNPAKLVHNPVMFIVELAFVIVASMAVDPALMPVVSSRSQQMFYIYVTVILLFTVWFSALSDSIAEAQVRSTASSLKQIEQEVRAKRLDPDRNVSVVSSKSLSKGDLIRIEKGERVPIDSVVLEGIAMVDESLLTGESAPVRKAPSDILIGGSMLVSDALVAQVSVDPGETYLSKLINMVENSIRPKTPNEAAISVLLLGLTVIFTVIIVSILWLSVTLSLGVDLSVLIALYVCLLPTTIGALLPAIGISGINRMSSNKIIAKSGKAIETAGDTDSILLDKTGTITLGNRVAVDFIPLGSHSVKEVGDAAFLSSWYDDTPEGRSIMSLAYERGCVPKEFRSISRAEATEFSASTRKSGLRLAKPGLFLFPKGGKTVLQRSRMRKKYTAANERGPELYISKGAPDAIAQSVVAVPEGFDSKVLEISAAGDTPMAITVDNEIVGLIRLKDRLKPGIRDKINAVKVMGIKPVMITGDQPLTAKSIASEVGIDDYVSQAKPETKMQVVLREQASAKVVAMIGDGTNDAPALAAADVGLAMASGTMAAKEAANMVDLESNPAKVIDVVMLGKQLLMTRGAVTTFSVSNDVAKYFAIVPVMFSSLPALGAINIMGLSPQTTVLAALIFNAAVIPALIPLALRGTKFKPQGTMSMFVKNALTYGLGGVVLPFIGIEAIGQLVRLL